MPLFGRARIEVYLPDRGDGAYLRLYSAFEREFLYTFGGCTVISGIKGLYLSTDRVAAADKINLIYADTPFEFDTWSENLSKYRNGLKHLVLESSDEESVLIVVHQIYHSV